MKKISILGLSMVGAVALTSCGAPTISVEQARVEAAGIQQKMESNGDYIAGSALKMDYKLNSEVSGSGAVERITMSSNIIFDLNNLYLKAVIEEEEYLKAPNYGEVKESEKFVVEAYVENTNTVVYTMSSYEDNKLEDEYKATFDLTNTSQYEQVISTMQNYYSTINSTFESAVELIFSMLSFEEEYLKQSGVTLGSYGAGSLVVTVDVKNESGSSYSFIEFNDYLLKKMESKVNYKQGEMSYNLYSVGTFEYGSYNK